MSAAFRLAAGAAALMGALLALGCEARDPGTRELTQSLSVASRPKADEAPRVVLDVTSTYPDPQVIGDKRGVSITKAPAGTAHSPPDAWAIEYVREKKGITRPGLGGICWQNRPGNQGDAPGDDLSTKGYRRVSFWARGDKGGEVVEFRAGGLGNIKTRHQDSFDVSLGKVRLGTSWSEHTLFLQDADLSSVITPFCVVIEAGPNPNGALVYVDDIEYSG